MGRRLSPSPLTSDPSAPYPPSGIVCAAVHVCGVEMNAMTVFLCVAQGWA